MSGQNGKSKISVKSKEAAHLLIRARGGAILSICR